MKTKTYTRNSAEEIDEVNNAFNLQHTVKYTQTHTNIENGKLVYTFVLFYEDK